MLVNETQESRKKGTCRYFQQGSCTYGDKCWYSHDLGATQPQKTSSQPSSKSKHGKSSLGGIVKTQKTRQNHTKSNTSLQIVRKITQQPNSPREVSGSNQPSTSAIHTAPTTKVFTTRPVCVVKKSPSSTVVPPKRTTLSPQENARISRQLRFHRRAVEAEFEKSLQSKKETTPPSHISSASLPPALDAPIRVPPEKSLAPADEGELQSVVAPEVVKNESVVSSSGILLVCSSKVESTLQKINFLS